MYQVVSCYKGSTEEHNRGVGVDVKTAQKLADYGNAVSTEFDYHIEPQWKMAEQEQLDRARAFLMHRHDFSYDDSEDVKCMERPDFEEAVRSHAAYALEIKGGGDINLVLVFIWALIVIMIVYIIIQNHKQIRK